EVISEGPATKYSRDIWLDITPDIRRNRAKYNQQYVLVEGTLNASEHGHMGMSRATIKSIKRFELANAKS
ncbi:MAG TPA: hypothetical protein VFU37_17300, partial [Pyrinomonadaceae bacterium]|nr:hypothetical protein [Pyrinomonadaceae bacterium]